MKVAVIKIGSRIAFGGRDTAGGNAEARYIIRMLHEGGADVSIYTKILNKDELVPEYHFNNIEETYKDINNKSYNALIVLNGNVNFFGGAEAPDQLCNYHMINNFKGKVFYIFCDPALDLKQIWGSVSVKEWGTKYAKDDVYISRKDIIYISQPYDIKAVQEIIDKGDIKVQNIVQYPLEKFVCLDKRLEGYPENPEWDLLYGGTMRGNRRIDKMIHFYFGYPDDIKVEMFGKIEAKDFEQRIKSKKLGPLKYPSFGKPVDFSGYMNKVNNTISHIVIGDKWYEGKDMPQRCYQSIWANTVTFIDNDLDPLQRVFKMSPPLLRFSYVNNREEVIYRLNAIKKDSTIRKRIIDEQYNAVDFNAEKYCTEFKETIENLL
jgi:hypothetical protein